MIYLRLKINVFHYIPKSNKIYILQRIIIGEHYEE